MRGINVRIPLFSRRVPLALSAAVVNVLLEALTQINILWLLANPGAPSIFDAGVLYQREVEGKEEWLTIPELYRLGFGDCEDLSCALAAWIRVNLHLPARAVVRYKQRPLGGILGHVTVIYKDRSGKTRTCDPSALLGMYDT